MSADQSNQLMGVTRAAESRDRKYHPGVPISYAEKHINLLHMFEGPRHLVASECHGCSGLQRQVREFSATEDRGPRAGTPWHKTTPARLEPI